MKLFTTELQTAKLIELGFEKPKSIETAPQKRDVDDMLCTWRTRNTTSPIVRTCY